MHADEKDGKINGNEKGMKDVREDQRNCANETRMMESFNRTNFLQFAFFVNDQGHWQMYDGVIGWKCPIL